MSLFGLTALHAAAGAAVPLAQPMDPFVWSGGGRRMSPEEVAAEQERAALMMAQGADFSPVGHWTQGLARASQGILGGLQARRAQKAGDANAAESDAVLRALMAGSGQGGNRDVVAAAMLNPNISDGARRFAEMEYKRMNPAPRTPTEFERELEAAGVLPGTPEWQAKMQQRVKMKVDPDIIVPTPYGPYVGSRAEFGSTMDRMGGGDPASTGPGAASPPAMLPPDFDFGNGGPTQPASALFP